MSLRQYLELTGIRQHFPMKGPEAMMAALVAVACKPQKPHTWRDHAWDSQTAPSTLWIMSLGTNQLVGKMDLKAVARSCSRSGEQFINLSRPLRRNES